MKHLLAVDWGTSSLRGALLDDQGTVLGERTFERGILTVKPGEFPKVFEACFSDWLLLDHVVCLIAGMAGSKQGWLEAPYCPCPAGFDEISNQICWLEKDRLAIVPGLTCENEGRPDVMRGEETQVLGALEILGLDEGVFILPGTHSKWVSVKNQKIQHFETLMTGEFYALLSLHSILAKSLPSGTVATDWSAFDQGVTLALRSRSLMATVFSVRTLSLFERLTATALPSYLSGLLIGEELRTQAQHLDKPLVVIGSPHLTERYQRALNHYGVRALCIGAEASWRGLWSLAQSKLKK
jgi:2-dehydro-3-deoxygalactonokinase